MDALVVVVDEGPWSVQTALRVRTLAGDIGLKNVVAVANRVTDATDATDLDSIREALQGIPIVGTLPYDPRLAKGLVAGANQQELRPTDVLTELLPALERLLQRLPAPSAWV
jgi:CO dehydrogenase maturation factor